MWSDFGRLRSALVGLLVGTAILFAIGIALEQSQRGEPAEGGAGVEEPVGSAEGGEAGEGHAESGEAGESSEERILGIDYEAPSFIALAVGVPLLLAALVWFRPLPWLFALGVPLGLGFAVLDLLEVQRQLQEGAAAIALIAILLAIGHLLVAGLSARLATMRPARA